MKSSRTTANNSADIKGTIRKGSKKLKQRTLTAIMALPFTKQSLEDLMKMEDFLSNYAKKSIKNWQVITKDIALCILNSLRFQ